MKFKLIAVALLAACSGPTTEQRIASLEAERAAIHADLLRQQAECQAQAIEFQGNPRVALACADALRTTAETAALVIGTIDGRIDALRRDTKPRI